MLESLKKASQLILVVNKMYCIALNQIICIGSLDRDSVNWSNEHFENIVQDVETQIIDFGANLDK